MNPQIQSEKSIETSMIPAVTTDTEALELNGFTTDEIVSLLYLRNWYETVGSDRVELVRRLEFLKLVLMNGTIDLYRRGAGKKAGRATRGAGRGVSATGTPIRSATTFQCFSWKRSNPTRAAAARA